MFVAFSFHIIYMRCKIGHAHCFNDHSMTDSDGKPLVFAYSLEYFDRYMKGHPDFLLVNGKPHTWSKKSAALAGGEC